MRTTRFLKDLLQLPRTIICGVELTGDGLTADVRPSFRIPRCSGCQRKVRSCYDTYKGRRWRHLDLAGMKIRLRYDIRRVNCPDCGVLIESVPWAQVGSWFTREFEEQVAYLVQRCDKTTVSQLMRIAWDTVGQIARRVVARHRRADPLDGLSYIGIDEISYRKHHKYLTVVVDHNRGAIVWAHEGKDSRTLGKFFEELGPERTAKLQAVTLDMSKAYIKAVSEAAPQAEIIFDRYHVQKLAHDALDEVRREQARELPTDDPEARSALKGVRWPLQKNPWNLSQIDARKLTELQRTNKSIYRAYLLKESLLEILDSSALLVCRRKLDEWLSWAARSRLGPFKRLAKTVREHKQGILAYIKTRFSNGRVEGINRKIRVITRRAYGFHSASSLIAMLLLCCSGIQLRPVHRYPTV